MKKILLIKTSSMGDIIHTLPALSDAGHLYPDIQFDWVVEESFADIPAWHPRVDRVIPVALRRWRKNLFSATTRAEWQAFMKAIKLHEYDVILDAQGLLKSALLTFFAKGRRIGLDFQSARESFASFAYQKKCTVNFYQHAIHRARELFSCALSYDMPTTPPDFGLDLKSFDASPAKENYLVFLHGTTWTTKLWPEAYWAQLAAFAEAASLRIKISGGNEDEIKRAKRIANASSVIDVLPRLSIKDMANLLVHAKAAVAVDTGFGHLAAALCVKTVSLYGPTNPAYTGAMGDHSIHLAADFPCSPCLSRTCTYRQSSEVTPACFQTIKPEKVWQAIQSLLSCPI